MNRYLVGGAVRDRLLGEPVGDRDWVVVGSTPEAMIAAGYRPVGKDFPVFLHPDTHEEHALARTERSSAPGYHGFVFNADPEVTLEEDLARRDLTINAIAEATDGSLIDPFDGQRDLERRHLRHVSAAFVEDPVRILRIARFMARLAPLGFTIAEETFELMRTMVREGEVDALVPERVWQELSAALTAARPAAFIDTLRACGALQRVMPEVDALFGVPQTERWHPEIDCGIHTLLVMQQARQLSDEPAVGLAALCHDLGKALTPPEQWPRHHDHEVRGVEPARQLCERLRVPKQARDLALLTTRYHMQSHTAMELKASTLLKLLLAFDVLRKPERLQQFVLVCTADRRGRWGEDDAPYPQAQFLAGAAEAIKTVDAAGIASESDDKTLIPKRIRQARLSALKRYCAAWTQA